MKKLLLTAALLLGITFFVNAQQGQGGRFGGTPEERAKRNIEQLNEKVKLNEDQKTKATAIYLEQGTKMTKLFESMGSGGDREAMRAEMTKFTEETNKKIEAILDVDQKKTFAAWQVERAEAMKKRMQGQQTQPAGGQ